MLHSMTSNNTLPLLRFLVTYIEPAVLFKSDDKWPDGAAVVRGREGKSRCGMLLAWILWPPSRIIAARGSGAVTYDAEYHKKNKVAVETLGAMGEEVFF